jgi:hypothetical protein
MYFTSPISHTAVNSIHKGVDWDIRVGRYGQPNHVHLRFGRASPERHEIRVPAREANRVIGRTGEPFWQKKSYDHWVRNPSEFEKIRMYIEANPVKAGLVRNPQDYPWSSAGVETSLDAARRSACATSG